MRVERHLLVLCGGALVIGGLTYVASSDVITADSAPSVALTVAVAAIGCPCGWMIARHRRAVGNWLQVAMFLTAIGAFRALDVPGALRLTAGVGWLVAPVALLLAVSADRVRPRLLVGLLGATFSVSVVTAGIAGVAGRGAWTEQSVGRDAAGAVRVLLAVWLLLLAASLVAVSRAVDGRDRSGPIGGATKAWGACTLVAAGAHLLAGRRVYELVSGPGYVGYRTWSNFVALNLALWAALAMALLLAYSDLVRPRLMRTTSGSLVLDDRPLDSVNVSLALWMGDPSVVLGYAAADGRWVDGAGMSIELPSTPQRSVTYLSSEGEPIAVLLHDPLIASRPGVVETAVAITSSAILADRQAALAESTVNRAAALNRRLLFAEDDAQRVLSDVLRSGVVEDLATLAAEVRSGRELVEVSEQIRRVTTEVRLISHGVFPPELDGGGLEAALPGARVAAAHRLPRAIELTVFLVARGRDDAAVTDRGEAVEVRFGGPAPAPNVLDRVAILDGRVDDGVIVLPITGG